MSENPNNMNQQYVNQNQAYNQAYPYYYYPQTSQNYYTRQIQPQQQPQQQQGVNNQSMLPIQQSYIENILRLNRGKEATVYMTFPNNSENFTGIIEAAGRDHIILSETETGKRALLLMVYLDYITFNEEINYAYPYDSTGLLSDYPPR